MKIALGIEYAGTHFYGWQKQPGKIRTVQTVLERTLSKIANHPIKTICAGRTDAGVHGLAQVIHFNTSAIRKINTWVDGGNGLLPPDVKVLWAEEVDENFNARFSALARTYQYVILNTSYPSALWHSLVTWEARTLNTESMNEAAQFLVGEHDFSSFRASDCQSKTAIRNVQFITIERQDAFIIITIKANAFLYHMVRNIVAVLLEIGIGNQSSNWMAQVLNAKNRSAASRTAPPNGLYLVNIDYPEELLLKNHARYPIFATIKTHAN